MTLFATVVACHSAPTTTDPTDTTPTHSTPLPTTETAGGSGGTAHSSRSAGHSAEGVDHSAHTGTPGTTHSGPVDLASLLPGTWRPTAVDGTPIADDPRRYWVFETNGDLVRGCGRPATGTWTFDEVAPKPAVGLIEAQFGPVPITWYVVTLTATELVYVEGGDVFEHVRDVCPP